MYSEEKDKLKKYKEAFETTKIPETLDDHIEKGFMKAKQENKRKLPFKWLLSVAFVTIVLVGFASTKYILEFVENNKGLVDAIKHDYYMEIGASKKINEVKFEVDGVIVDDHGMVLFYTIHSDVKGSELRLSDIELDHKGVEQDDLGFISYGGYGAEKERFNGKAFSGMIEIFYNSPIKVNEFTLKADIRGSIPDGRVEHFFGEDFHVSFTLPEEILTRKTYELNETVSIEGQNVTFTEAVVSPIRAEVRVKMDPDNTKKILNFDDLQFIDETGEVWGIITDGVTGSFPSEDKQIIYLQSNYFSDPKELYLTFSKVQAIDKDEQFIVVDPVKKKILKQPKGNELTEVKIDMSYLVFYPKGSLFEDDYPLSLGSVYNNDGEVLESFSSYMRNDEIGISLYDLSKETEPVSVEINQFPAWITGETKIRVK